MENFYILSAGSLFRYFLIAGGSFLVFYVLFADTFKKIKIQEKEVKKKNLKIEILNSLTTNVVFTIIFFFIYFTDFKKHTLLYDNINDYPLYWIPISLIFNFVINDTYFYWTHKWYHSNSKIFKIVHLIHHKSYNPSPLASYSFNAIESILQGLIMFVFVLIIPCYSTTLFIYFWLAFIANVYGHLGYEISPRWMRKTFLFEFITSSVHHNIHHQKFNYNFGLYFRIWDRIMGTEYPKYVEEYDRIKSFEDLKITPLDNLKKEVMDEKDKNKI